MIENKNRGGVIYRELLPQNEKDKIKKKKTKDIITMYKRVRSVQHWFSFFYWSNVNMRNLLSLYSAHGTRVH